MPKNPGPALEQLHAELIQLMNQYTGQPSPLTAASISSLLQRILRHPLIELFPELRNQCARGLNQWRCRAATPTLAPLSTPSRAAGMTLH